MSVKQISVFLPHMANSLMEFARVLRESEVNIRAFSIAEAPDFGIARVIVDDFARAEAALKAAGYVLYVTTVLVVAIPDRAGGLYEVLSCFAAAGIDVRYTYAFTGSEEGVVYRAFRVDDEAKAAAALAERQIQLAEQADL